MAVADQIRLALDRMAKGRQNSQANFAGGVDFWDLGDAAQDELYENTVKGADLTALDAELAAGATFGTPVRRKWFDLHETYFGYLGLSGSPRLATYLAEAGGYRVAYEAAEACYSALGVRLPAERVFPRGTRPADGANPGGSGMHEFITLTGTAGDPVVQVVDGGLPSSVGGAGVLLINKTGTTSITDLVLRCTRQDNTTVELAVTLSGGGQYKQTILGAQGIGAAGAASGQAVIPVAATAQFKVGEWVLIYKSDAVQEVGQVAAIVDNTNIALESDLINSYAQNDLVIPLFTNVAWASGTVADTKVIGVYAYPDRVIAL